MHRFNNIPQVAYFFWGHTPMPWLNAMTIKSFKQLNPEWHVCLIQPESKTVTAPTWSTPEQKIPYAGADYLPEVFGCIDEIERLVYPEGLHDATMADLTRQEIMYFRGGLWVDMDVINLKPINDLQVPDDIDILVCEAGKPGHRYFSTGVVMASPKTKYYYVLTDAIQHVATGKTYQAVGPDMVRDKFKSIEEIREIEPIMVVSNIPLSDYYAIKYNELRKLYNQSHKGLLESAMGVHWYGGATESMKVRNHMTPDTVSEYEGTTVYDALTIAGVI
jgi:hypothetical protein